MSQSKLSMRVTPEKYHTKKIIASILYSPRNNETLLRKCQKYSINLKMKYQKLQRPIVLIVRKQLSIIKIMKYHKPL